jgi:hypothetical protein
MWLGKVEVVVAYACVWTYARVCVVCGLWSVVWVRVRVRVCARVGVCVFSSWCLYG